MRLIFPAPLAGTMQSAYFYRYVRVIPLNIFGSYYINLYHPGKVCLEHFIHKVIPDIRVSMMGSV